MAFIKGFKSKTAKRPEPDARPDRLYPCVPEDSGETKKIGSKMNKKLFGKLKGSPPPPASLPEKRIGPQMQMEPLGATMPNQGTGGGIAGGYGSN